MPKSKRRKRAAPPPPPSRYTPPKPKTEKHSALWVPSMMFACLLTGLAVIVGNFLQVLPGGAARNSYLVVGLGLLISGFVLSTQYR